MKAPSPPAPFDPDVFTLDERSSLYRVHDTRRGAADFNPGVGAPSRFAFFDGEDSKVVPVLYAGERPDVAVAETLLHDLLPGSYLSYDNYSKRVMSRLVTNRPLRLANLRGLGLRRFGVPPEILTGSPPSTYADTVTWSRAAHRAGLDGVAWTSRQRNDAAAYVFFADKCADAFDIDPGYAKLFATGEGLMWLIDLCAPLRIDVLPRPR